jgi:CRP/FNR family transcriptional regulator, cyclic AMP receptor protein
MATREDKTALFAGLPIFSSLSEEELSELAALAVPRNWEAGEVVFREGDRGETCFVIQTGAVRVLRGSPGGRSITLAEMRDGDMFGELAIFDGEERSATVEAIEETSAVALLASDVRRLLLSHPDTAVKMLSALARRLRTANEQIARQSFQTVAGRVAAALLEQVDARSDGGEEPRDVLIEATQTDIAQLAGSTRESTSRFLAELERAGLVTTGRGKVIVHDPGALRNYIY